MLTANQNANLINRLAEVETQIARYKTIISDESLYLSPLSRVKEINELISKNKHANEMLALDIKIKMQDYDEISRKLKSQKSNANDKVLHEINNKLTTVLDDLENLSSKTEQLNQERSELETLQTIISSDDFKKYVALYSERIKLKSQLKIDKENELTEIKAFRKSTSQSSFDLLETISKHIKESPLWYDNFEKRHDFKLVANDMNGVMPIKFVSKNGSTIEVDNDVISASPKLTTETMKQVGPALLAILIKCIETTHMPGCVITDGSQEVIQYMEKLYAEALKNKHPNFTINGKSIDTILSANPKINQIDNSASADKENLVNVDRLNNHHK